MARTGIYKAEVIRARDRLLAMGRYPSIDAVRAELGNTGSKGTIHRYLKEIEEEEGPTTGTKVAVSEAIQDLVVRLAGRLHEESDVRIAEACAKFTEQTQKQNEIIATLKQEAEAFRVQLERSQQALAEEKTCHGETAVNCRNETLARTQLSQQVTDLQERVAVDERHRQSLEEKHQHARDTLEHFRQSVKEQREQELRQHEQQVQYLQGELRTVNQALSSKQQDLTGSQQENTRLANDLARAQTDLHQARSELHALRQVKEELASSERRVEELGRRLVEQHAVAESHIERNGALEREKSVLKGRIQMLEVELAGARATSATQEQMIENIRTHFAAPRAEDQQEPTKSRVAKAPRPRKDKTPELLFKSAT